MYLYKARIVYVDRVIRKVYKKKREQKEISIPHFITLKTKLLAS